MISKITLEKFQSLFYLLAIVLGLIYGSINPEKANSLEIILWPILAFLLFVTFSQIPVVHLPKTYFNFRFILAALIGNFVLIPVLVTFILLFIPEDKVIKLGIALVLLVPCTDWFITFTKLGKGDTKYAIALAPVILFAQFLLLPFYIFLIFGKEFTLDIAKSNLIEIFIWFIAIPLLFAYIIQKLADTKIFWKKSLDFLSWLPVPLLTIVIFIIFSSQYKVIASSQNIFGTLSIVFIIYLIFSVLIAKFLSTIFKLNYNLGRVLAFNLSTRNSFVVLPLALALPEQYHITVVVIAYQPLIELIGMLIYIKIIPEIIFKETTL